MRATDRVFLDDRIPALDDKTPREAALDPKLRPRLLRILKQRVRAHDERNLRTGRTDDINWLLRELGADEIDFEPPPWRPPLPEQDLENDEDLDVELELEPNLDLPPPPPLPATPLSLDEAGRRANTALAQFETAAEAMDALLDSGSTLIADASEITTDMITDDEFAFSVPFLLQAWFALVPPGHRAPKIQRENLEDAFYREFEQMVEAVESGSPDRLTNFSKTGRQPDFMLLLATQLIHSGMNAPKRRRPSTLALGVMLALVKTVVDELDVALRERSIHPA
jgi:hypothetical protein